MGPGMRTLEYLDCPECGVSRPLAFRGGNLQTLHFACPGCLPGPLTLGRHIPGLPSDLTFLRQHGERLVAEAYEELRDEIRARREAGARANALLEAHLSQVQREAFHRTQSFNVGSHWSADIVYEVRCANPDKAFVLATGSPEDLAPEDFERGLRAVPQLGEKIRLAATNKYRTSSSVPFCLQILGPWIPLGDQALGLKLFLESCESRAWIKGMRIHLGLPQETMRPEEEWVVGAG